MKLKDWLVAGLVVLLALLLFRLINLLVDWLVSSTGFMALEAILYLIGGIILALFLFGRNPLKVIAGMFKR